MKNQLTVDLDSHLINPVKYIDSPNADDRPRDMPLELVVIHGISLPPGKFGGEGVEKLFTNSLDVNDDPYFKKIEHLRVSAHLFIKRDGELIQFVPFNKRAWHAGQSSWCGKEQCNDFSIGIELEGTDDQPYTASQYEVLEQVLTALVKAYPTIDLSAIKGHSDVSPGRKTDPGRYFLWDAVERFKEKMQ